jgi:mono/diheme cytochrome c family protein
MRRGLWLGTLLCLAGPALSDDAVARGEKLYRGAVPLNAMIAGQRSSLPAPVVACVNCHTRGATEIGGDSLAAPDMRGGWLTLLRSRRNGPVSQYAEATFCRALRTGIDPAYVTLPIQMPRFAISDPDCAALWTFLDQQS